MNWKRKRVMTAKSLLDNGLLKLLANVLHRKRGTQDFPECPVPIVRPCILADFPQVISNGGTIQVVMAEFPVAMHQDRHPFAKALLQRRIAVDINNDQIKGLSGL